MLQRPRINTFSAHFLRKVRLFLFSKCVCSDDNMKCGERMQDLKRITACFTGHRNIPPEDLPMVKEKLRKVLIKSIENGYRFFGAGGARGFDILAEQTVLELKSEYPMIKLILVLPCKEQTRGWTQHDIAEYEKMKAKADKVVYTSEHYYNGCMHKRNRHLVDHSNLCICYYTGQKGGTEYTVEYAKEKGVQVINLY